MQTDDRLHALDAMRAFALLSGIVLHATMTFMPGLASIGFPADVSQSVTLQILFYVIHTFRMTLFFVIAGYFARRMFHRKGMLGFAQDRVQRILVPLIVGWVVFGPLVIALIGIVLHPTTMAAQPAPATQAAAFPLAHLWFLYYLLIFYCGTIALRRCCAFFDRKNLSLSRVDAMLRRFVQGYGVAAVLAAPLALCLYLTPQWIIWMGIASPDRGFMPQLSPVIGFGTAFIFGWLLNRQSDLMQVWKRRWAMHLALAIVFTIASLRIAEVPAGSDIADAHLLKLAGACSYSLAMWNWVFGIIGMGLKYFAKESAVRRYLADASYWLYLAHLPLVFALQMLVLRWNLHWAIKFPLIVGVTVAVLLVSYRYLVRYSFIGEILNGRKYAGRLAIVAAGPQVVLSEAQYTTAGADDSVVAELVGVHKKYGTTIALDGIDLQIRCGELLAILGPNGAGKSTAVSLMLGLHEPDAGAVELFGIAPHLLAARRHVGVMLQEVALTPELRVRELIDLSAHYYETPFTVHEVLQMTHTAPLASRPYGKLSGGQKRLVQFAMAVCGRPKLLFLDEPTVGLDIQAREAMWTTLRRLVSEGCSIVLTTHYLEEAEALADRVVVMAKGKVVALGSVQEVRALVARKRITCVSALSAAQISHWPNVTEVIMKKQHLRITVTDAETVVRRLLNADATISELEISSAGLAEAFTELTQEAA